MLTTDQVLGKGRYRVISNFGGDDAGRLYKAYDTVSNTTVVLRESIGSGGRVTTAQQLDAVKNAFAGEAQALKNIHHDSVLSVQDFFSEIDRHYLVMESVDGSDLTKFLNPDESSPALTDLLSWTEQLLDALNYLHTLPTPIIHRDVRPASIRLTSNFKVKLLTAGISGNSDEIVMESAGDPSDSNVLNYRPLEQVWGGLDPASQKVIANSYNDQERRDLYEPLDGRSDLYSLGATLYHVISRSLPKDALERSIELLDGKPDPLLDLAKVSADVPEAVSEFVMKALALKRSDRYRDAAEMRDSLTTVRKSISGEKTAPSSDRANSAPLAGSYIKSAAKDAEAPLLELEVEQKRTPEGKSKDAGTEHLAAGAGAPKGENYSDDQFLLEVPIASEPVNDSFEWSDEELYVSDHPNRLRAVRETTSDINFGYTEAPRSNFKFVAAGAGALVVIIAVVGWLFMGGTSSQNQSAQSPPPAQQPVQEVQETTPVSSYTEAAPTPESFDVNTPETSKQTTEIQTSAAVKQQKKPAPTPAKTPEKKKVTVDDLINDN